MAAIVVASAPAFAQERHIARGKHIPIFEAGQKAERGGDEALEAGDDGEAKQAYRKAINRYQNVIIIEPKFVPGYVRLARVHAVMGEPKKAAALLYRALQYEPNNINLKAQLGISLAAGGLRRQGVAVLEEVAKVRTPSPRMLDLMADYYLETKKREKAVATLEKIVEQKRDAYRRWVQLGRTRLALRRVDGAQKAFEQVPSSAKSNYPTAVMGLGDTMMRRKKPDTALRRYLEAEKLRPGREISLRVAAAQRATGAHQEALKRYAVITKQAPKDPRGWYGAGQAYRGLERHQEALDSLQKALRLYARSPRIYDAISRTYLRLGNVKAAIANQVQATRLAPDDWRLQAHLGALYRRDGRVRLALAVHKKLAATRKWSAELATQVGHDQYFLRQPRAAMASYNYALKKDGDAVGAKRGIVLIELRDTVAMVRKKNLDGAAKALDRALTYNVLKPSLEEMRAAIEIERRKPQMALKWLDRTKPKSIGWKRRYLRGRALVMLERGKEALAALSGLDSSAAGKEKNKVELVRGAAEVLAGEHDAGISRLRALGGKGAARKWLAAGLVMRAGHRWASNKARAALADLDQAVRMRGALDAADLKRAELLRALAAGELGQKRASLRALRAFERMRNPPADRLLSKQFVGKIGQLMLRSYIYYTNGAFDRAAAMLEPALRKGSKVVAGLYRAVVRGWAYRSYVARNRRAANKAAAKLRRAVPKLTPTDELLLACIEYLGNKKAGVARFRKLSGKLPEADLNVGIYQDDVAKDKKAAYDAYKTYLQRRQNAKVKAWVSVKKRIFGYK